jgi:CubicO group peptidase (beta-lactamase class C family)
MKKLFACLALLAGVAQARGLLPDVDRPVAAQLPGIGFNTPHNAPITWRQLLEQTSEWEGSCFGLPDQVDRWRKAAEDANAQPLLTWTTRSTSSSGTRLAST